MFWISLPKRQIYGYCNSFNTMRTMLPNPLNCTTLRINFISSDVNSILTCRSQIKLFKSANLKYQVRIKDTNTSGYWSQLNIIVVEGYMWSKIWIKWLICLINTSLANSKWKMAKSSNQNNLSSKNIWKNHY